MRLAWESRIVLGSSLILLSAAILGYLAVPQRSTVADSLQLADLNTGKTITPTSARGAIFQELNPGHKAAPELRAD